MCGGGALRGIIENLEKRILTPPTTTIAFLTFKPEKMHSPIILL